MSCNDDDLLALARDRLPAVRARQVEEHTDGCAACRDELAWLRAEAGMFARRAAATPPRELPAWDAVVDRINVSREQADARKRRRRAWAFGAVGASLAAAAVAVFLIVPRAPEQAPAPPVADDVAEPDPKQQDQVVVAVERAEKEYARAIDALDAAYEEQRAHLSPEVAKMRDAEVRRLRRELDEIRGLAGDDPDARLRALRVTAAYVRSMQTLVMQEELP